MELQGININTKERDEHVPAVERYIRTLKEKVWATIICWPSRNCPTN